MGVVLGLQVPVSSVLEADDTEEEEVGGINTELELTTIEDVPLLEETGMTTVLLLLTMGVDEEDGVSIAEEEVTALETGVCKEAAQAASFKQALMDLPVALSSAYTVEAIWAAISSSSDGALTSPDPQATKMEPTTQRAPIPNMSFLFIKPLYLFPNLNNSLENATFYIVSLSQRGSKTQRCASEQQLPQPYARNYCSNESI